MDNYEIKINVLGYCGGFPRPGLATCSILLQTEEGEILVDCGSGSLSNYFKVSDVDKLDGFFLSHLHYDHMADIGCLQYAINHARRVDFRNGKLPVYAPMTPDKMWDAILYPHTDTTALKNGMVVNMAGMNISVFEVSHTIECYAFKFERNGKSFVYFTDTTFREDAVDFIGGCDLMFCESTSSEGSRHSTGIGHMSDLEAGKLAKLGGAKRLCLYHLPSDVELENLRKNAETTYGDAVLMPYDNDGVFTV